MSRRQLLTRGAAVITGSMLSHRAGYASDDNTLPVAETFAIPEEDRLQGVLAGFEKAAAQQDRIKAVVISQNAEIIFGRAFRGPSIDRAVNIKSVSKSVVATLLGIARQRSVISTLEQTLGELTPQLLPPGAPSRVADLTLQDLVTMRAGLERTSGRAYGVWVNSDNWIHHVLSRPFVDEPGGRMLYSTGDTHVLGAVLSQLTGRTLYQLARDWLGKPLGIDFSPWTRDPQGYYLGGNEMALSPLHLVKLGELYLANGVVDGNKLLDTNWVQDAFTPRTHNLCTPVMVTATAGSCGSLRVSRQPTRAVTVVRCCTCYRDCP